MRGTATAPLQDVTETETNGRASILLVDDDPELLKALAKVIEKDGFAVTAFPDADAAIRHIQTTRCNFDVIVTDVSMPGMSGTEFLAALKKAFPAVPVIIVTAFGDWGEYMDALREGAFAYLTKPVEKSELLATVHRAHQHLASAKRRKA